MGRNDLRHPRQAPAQFAQLMRVLIYHFTPFALAHGGQQVQITRTHAALRDAGIDAEYLDWHRADQAGDILHFFGRIPEQLVRQAHRKGMRVVIADLLAGQGARSAGRLQVEQFIRRTLEMTVARDSLTWISYRKADACIALTSWEAELLKTQFDVPSKRIHVVPNGVEDEFLTSSTVERGQWLLCVATIYPVKRVLELAQAAVLAKTPLQVVGRPFAHSDRYASDFIRFAQNNPALVRYEGAIEDRAKLARVYRGARGFVLLSEYESLSLAALEAAACECPLLLSDLPWAHSAFGSTASYCPVELKETELARKLRTFYDTALEAPKPARPLSWRDVGMKLKAVYASLV